MFIKYELLIAMHNVITECYHQYLTAGSTGTRIVSFVSFVFNILLLVESEIVPLYDGTTDNIYELTVVVPSLMLR